MWGCPVKELWLVVFVVRLFSLSLLPLPLLVSLFLQWWLSCFFGCHFCWKCSCGCGCFLVLRFLLLSLVRSCDGAFWSPLLFFLFLLMWWWWLHFMRFYRNANIFGARSDHGLLWRESKRSYSSRVLVLRGRSSFMFDCWAKECAHDTTCQSWWYGMGKECFHHIVPHGTPAHKFKFFTTLCHGCQRLQQALRASTQQAPWGHDINALPHWILNTWRSPCLALFPVHILFDCSTMLLYNPKGSWMQHISMTCLLFKSFVKHLLNEVHPLFPCCVCRRLVLAALFNWRGDLLARKPKTYEFMLKKNHIFTCQNHWLGGSLSVQDTGCSWSIQTRKDPHIVTCWIKSQRAPFC